MCFKLKKAMACCLVALAILAPVDGYGSACGPYGCPTERPPDRREEASSLPRPSIGRVSHRTAQGVFSGTATLVAHEEGTSYFVTCAHLFDDGPGRTEVASKTLGRLPARLLAMDRGNDLVLLETARCNVDPAKTAELQSQGDLTACGFGPVGQFRCVRGPIAGYAQPEGATSPSLRMRGAVRPGDSGGPVFDRLGRLVAVIWGERRGETYATFGKPLRRILGRLPRRRPGLVPVERIPSQKPTLPPPPSIANQPNEDQVWRDRVEGRLSASESLLKSLDLSQFANRDELHKATSSWSVRVGRMETRLRGIAAKVAGRAIPAATAAGWMAPLLTALGIGGPVGAALFAGQFLIRRRVRSRRPASDAVAIDRPIVVDSPPPPQRVVPETHYVSYERDEYAKAHQWASEQLVRKFPGSVEMITSLDSLIRQRMNAFD